jgi:hypothetical protein
MLNPDAKQPGRSEMPGLTAGVVVDGGGARVSDAGGSFELRAPAEPLLPDDLAEWWTSIGGRCVIVGDTIDCVVVRPDGYGFGTSDDPAALLNALRSMLSNPVSVAAHSVASI